ncbi:MAG: glycosyltransferase [Candidatus Limnocylindrales bacterium]|jgi:glycosyltransferase involved in cell wall biosynthesis
MKVLFLSRWYPSPERPYHGIFVREHARSARAAGHEVAVLHVPEDKVPVRWLYRLVREPDPKLTEGIPTYHLHCRRVSLPRLARISGALSYGIFLLSTVAAYRRIRRDGFRPDLFHANVWSSSMAASLLARLTRRPFVVTEHATAFPNRALSATAVSHVRHSYPRAAAVMPVSENLRQAIEAYGVHATFQVVPNAVDTSLFWNDPMHCPGDPKHLVFVGALEPSGHKGFPTLAEALVALRERRRDWHLDVVGDGPSRAGYQQLIADRELDGLVTFHGSRPKAEIAAMMRDADLFVLPSRFENLPCVIIEAMTSGLPIVSTRVGGIPEMVSDDEGILVEPDDAPALTAALDCALSGLGRFDRSSIAAQARQRYSLENVGRQLGSIYEAIVAGR